MRCALSGAAGPGMHWKGVSPPLPPGHPAYAGGGEYYARTGLGLCNAQSCTMHFDEDTWGLQTRGILGLLTICRLAAGGTPRSSSFSDDGRISSSCKACSAVETSAGAFWWTKLSMINTTMNCIGQESSRALCTIMHDYARASFPLPCPMPSHRPPDAKCQLQRHF